MLGIIVLIFFGTLFRRRGNSWPKTILKTAGVYVVYLFLLYGGIFTAVNLPGLIAGPPNSSTSVNTQRIATSAAPVDPVRLTPSPVESSGPQPSPTVATSTTKQDTLSGGSARSDVAAATDRVGCDPAYPEERTCIPPGPPFNQGCAITSERVFKVLPPDPQGLDHDADGIGCEPIVRTSAPVTSELVIPVAPSEACDMSYPDVCIPSPPPDLDCKDIAFGNFRAAGADPTVLAP